MRKRLLLFLLILPLLFSACGNTAGSGASAEPAELPETDTSFSTVVENGKTDYTLIRPDNAEPEELEAAQIVFKAFQDIYDIRIAFETDFVKPGSDPSAYYSPSILIGKTNRGFSETCAKDLG